VSRAALLAALALPLAAAASDLLAGRVAGPPQQCVALSRLSGPEVIDANTILYRESGRRIWRTGAVGHCAVVRPLDTLIVEVYGNQLCANDRFRVVRPGTIIPSASCRFQPFVPFDKPAR
jgi:hypothetical protein